MCSGSQYKGWNIPLHSIPPPRRAQSVLGVSVQGLETSLHSPSPCCRAQTVLGVSAQGPGAPHVGDFSTDNHGHCYFYGERLDAGNTSKVCAGGALGGGKQGEPAGEDKKRVCVCVKLPHIDHCVLALQYRPPSFMDNGPWEYNKKYHLRANTESPVQPR